MFEYSDYKIILCCGATDMRKSINEVILCDCDCYCKMQKLFYPLGQAEIAHKLFLTLVWADNGFWIHFKRIERGRVVWPTEEADEKTMILAYDDLKNIIIAPGITQKIKRTEVWKKC